MRLYSVALNITSIDQPLNFQKYMQQFAYQLVSIKGTILDTVLGIIPTKRTFMCVRMRVRVVQKRSVRKILQKQIIA